MKWIDLEGKVGQLILAAHPLVLTGGAVTTVLIVAMTVLWRVRNGPFTVHKMKRMLRGPKKKKFD